MIQHRLLESDSKARDSTPRFAHHLVDRAKVQRSTIVESIDRDHEC